MSPPEGLIRVLVADDSTTSRELLVTLLSADPAITVVGQAANGVEAVEMTSRLRPSLVVMDIHMPVMDGFEATKRIMIDAPTPVVIVTGAANARGVEMSLRAVQMGALTVLPKPPGPDDADFGAASQRLVSIAKALSQVRVVRRRRDPAATRVQAHPVQPLNGWAVEVLAIAASTGGPPALYRLLEALPRTTRVPILVVQHISEGFAPGLVAWLGSGSPLPVKLAEHGDPLLGGTVYVAPDDRHLEVSPQRRVLLSQGPRVDGFRPSATVLFRSVAAVYGANAAGVVLTGMGRDGLEGLTELRRVGGRVLAQDEATSVVFGMPGVVVKAGLAHVVAPVEELAAELAAAVASPA
ncbi:MAG: chemotaxis-specific protein-glutamate methyltransferase CheB [Actinobacteria bacterium]|nr:chemotaxis-specific protein-glutamate methyltransferase CheB [Actinomycetota bacterium]MBW3651552.1 chemotaxis-specific protein-glutamate methyltransferase CheB [Actinomycetota bacterium]